MKTQCVIYARVSTNLQDTESQIQDLQKWVKYNDYEVKEIFKESISGYDKGKERPELDRLKEFIKDHKIKQVITYELSRLGRSTQQTLTEIKYFTGEGVNIYFKKDNINTISENGINNLIITILSGIAEMEGVTLKERVKRGRMLSASKGKRVGFNKMPLGYAADERGYIIINEEDADIVRTMYKAVASGISAGRLAKDLNSKGIPTYNDKMGKRKILRNGDVVDAKWNPKSIKNIIKNTRYLGFRNYGGEILPVPKIVDKEIWEEANQKINEHTGYLSRTKYNYLFKSKITCGQCGYTLKSLRKYSKKLGDKKFKDVLYYTCQSYLHTGENCDCGRFRSEVFDKYLYTNLFERAKGIKAALNKESSESEKTQLAKRLSYWNKEKDSLTKEQNKVKTLFIKGFVEEEEMDKEMGKIVSKINEVTIEISRLERAIRSLNKPKDFSTEVLKKYYFEANFATRREFVEQYVQRIKTYKVDTVDFDLTKVSVFQAAPLAIKDWYNETNSVRLNNFSSPKKNEVIWYVEVWAYDDINPIKILMTSATGTNYSDYRLKFNKGNRSITLQ